MTFLCIFPRTDTSEQSSQKQEEVVPISLPVDSEKGLAEVNTAIHSVVKVEVPLPSSLLHSNGNSNHHHHQMPGFLTSFRDRMGLDQKPLLHEGDGSPTLTVESDASSEVKPTG